MYEDYVEKGLLMTKKHDGLVLFNYTRKCQIERAWDEVTLNNRGHVYEEATGKPVAYTFPKFFNFEELSEEDMRKVLRSEHYTVTAKIDGTLGIIYYYKGKWRVNTRGSFNSEQAQHALKKIDPEKLDPYKGWSIIVEIVYPENQIVIDYGDEDALYLLAIYDDKGNEITEIGKYAKKFGFKDVKIPKILHFSTIESILRWKKEAGADVEGVVVRLYNGMRVKFKSNEYFRLATTLKKINRKYIVKHLVNGKYTDYKIDSYPAYIKNMINAVEKEYDEKLTEMRENSLKYANYTDKELFTKLPRDIARQVKAYKSGRHETYIKSALLKK